MQVSQVSEIEDTRCADENDRASAIEQQINEENVSGGLEKARSMMSPQQHPDFDGETCVECGEDLPKERLMMGRIYCVECQSLKEQRYKRGMH